MRRFIVAGVLLVVGVGGYALLRGNAAGSTNTIVVTRGEYSDIVEIRGQIQPVKSIYVTAPLSAGELQILKMAANGTTVKAGDVVAEFDAVTLRRTIQEKEVELRSGNAELGQGQAQSAITTEEKQAAVKKAEFDVLKAKLALGELAFVAAIDGEKAKLAVADAEQRLREAQASVDSAPADARADRQMRERTIEKTKADLEMAQRQVAALRVTAPTDGTVSIQPNYRSTTPMGTPQEYRAGDRAYPGANILELPDLSSVYLTARIDEADRGKLIDGADRRDSSGRHRRPRLQGQRQRHLGPCADRLYEWMASAQAVRLEADDPGSGPAAAAGDERGRANHRRPAPERLDGAGRIDLLRRGSNGGLSAGAVRDSWRRRLT